MKTKFLFFFFIIGMFFLIPSVSHAQITEESLDMLGEFDGELSPVSVETPLLAATLNHINKTLKVDFLSNLGRVTFQIVDESNRIYLAKEVMSVEGGFYTFNLSSLPAGKYKIICFIPNKTKQAAYFELYK